MPNAFLRSIAESIGTTLSDEVTTKTTTVESISESIPSPTDSVSTQTQYWTITEGFPGIIFDLVSRAYATRAGVTYVRLQGTSNHYWQFGGATGPRMLFGPQSTPNGYYTGNPGDIYMSSSGGAGMSLWVKESGANTNEGWIPK